MIEQVVEIQSEEELDSIIAADDRPVSCLAALFPPKLLSLPCDKSAWLCLAVRQYGVSSL